MSLGVEVRIALGALRLEMKVQIEEGEVVALLGPNGAGKTTLLRAIAGLVPIQSGRVELEGQTLEEPATGRYIPTEQRSIGFVFQDYLLFPHLSVLDNVAFGLRARGASRAEAGRRAMSWIERVGLENRAGSRPAELSGGERQRVALARALAPDPRVLLLDEPFTGLDRIAAEALSRLLGQHAAAGRATVLVTHNVEEGTELATDVAFMRNGRFVHCAPRSGRGPQQVGEEYRHAIA